MMIRPGPRHRYPDVTITPYSQMSCGLNQSGGNSIASGTWGTANMAWLFPLYPPDPFVVAKAGWANGATVGTDSIDIGVYRMTDIATGRCDLLRSTGAVLSAGTVSRAQETATFRVARKNVTSGSSSTDANNYDTASVTLKAGRLYLMSVENSHGTTASAVSAITGGGTWAVVAPGTGTTLYNGNLNRISIWSCVPTVDYTGTINIAFGGTTQTGACWSLDEQSGVDTASNNGIVQAVVGTGSSATALATLAAFASANNATFAAHGHAAATASAPGTGFTELADVTAATPAQALCTDWRVDNDTTADATFTSAAWGSVAVEVKADTSAFIIPAATQGVPDLYMAMAISGTTATVLRSTLVTPSAVAAGMLQAASSFPLPSTLTAAIASGPRVPMAGFSSRSLLA